MTARAPRAHLQSVLDRLDAAGADDRRLSCAVRGRPRQDRFWVPVAGEANRDSWIRRHLPGNYARTRSRAHLAREVYVGRVCSDIQQRLAVSTRPMKRAVAARYTAVTRRLRAVLDETEHPAPAGEQTGSAALADRASTLRRILAELTPPDGGTPAARSVPGR
jgi:hypothetical protein